MKVKIREDTGCRYESASEYLIAGHLVADRIANVMHCTWLCPVVRLFGSRAALRGYGKEWLLRDDLNVMGARLHCALRLKECVRALKRMTMVKEWLWSLGLTNGQNNGQRSVSYQRKGDDERKRVFNTCCSSLSIS